MSELEKRVLDEIAARKLAPRPAYVFLARRSVFLALAGLSLAMGALSFALMFFIVADYFATGLRTVDNMPFDELVPAILLVWLACLAVFLISATFAMRKTQRGYRFTMRRLLAISLVSSLALGGFLHVVGAGREVHEWVEWQFPAYSRFIHVPFAEWSQPDKGFLGGTVLEVNGTESFTLRDFHDVIWTIDISAATIELDSPLAEEGDVAILGKRTGATGFKANTIREFD